MPSADVVNGDGFGIIVRGQVDDGLLLAVLPGAIEEEVIGVAVQPVADHRVDIDGAADDLVVQLGDDLTGLQPVKLTNATRFDRDDDHACGLFAQLEFLADLGGDRQQDRIKRGRDIGFRQALFGKGRPGGQKRCRDCQHQGLQEAGRTGPGAGGARRGGTPWVGQHSILILWRWRVFRSVQLGKHIAIFGT